MAGAKIQNAVAKTSNKKSMADWIKVYEPEIKKALPSVITPERFTRMALTAVSINPALGDCTPQSFLASMFQAAQLGLEPNTSLGQAWLIPYKNNRKGCMEVEFQIGYKGMIDLAYRSGEVELIQAQIVYSNDEFKCEYGLEPKLIHRPADGDRGVAVKVYAMFKTKAGGYGFEVMSMDEVRAHAKAHSTAYVRGSSPWQTNFEEMAKKTVLKRVLKYAPLKTEFVRGISQDETVKTQFSEDMYSVPDESETVFEGTYTEVEDEPEADTVSENS